MPEQVRFAAHGCEEPTIVKVRERLLTVAERIMSRQGYAGTSIAEIVEKAGVGAPTLYWHFKSKRGLLLAVMQRGAARWRATLPKPGSITRGTPRQRFLKSMAIAGEGLVAQPQFLRLLTLLALELGDDDAEVRDGMRAGRERARNWMIALTHASWPTLPLASANQMAMKMMAVFDGVILQQVIESEQSALAMHLWVHAAIADEAEALIANISKKE